MSHVQLRLSVICFSKDRPWQLEQLIRSVLQYWVGSHLYDYYVLYQASSAEFERAYKCLLTELSADHFNHIHFIKESRFSVDLLNLITKQCQSDYVCFHVDDMLFYRAFHIERVLQFLHDSNHRLIAFFPKLNENINYSHPSSTPAPTPVFTTKLQFKQFHTWMPAKASSDWNYLWDLCGTVYAKQDVLTIYHGIKQKFGENAVSSPNKFEVHGNKVMYLIYPGLCMKMFAACTKKAIMSVITVNRVQNDYNVPIYEEHQKTTQQLLHYFVNERKLDLMQYSQQTYHSVHIHSLYLLPQKEQRTKNRMMVLQSEDESKEDDDSNVSKQEVEEWRQWLIAQCDRETKQSKQD